MKKVLVLLILILFILFCYFIYDNFAYTNVLVKFDDLEPFEKQMNVYFKGFKVGKTTKIYPNEDFTNTYLKLKLKSSSFKFPSNIKVNIKKKKSGGYVDIIYPSDPTIARLKTNDEIQGLITKDISALMESENLEDIVDDAGSLIENASIAVQSLNSIFVEIKNILVDNRKNINLAVLNFTMASKNLNKLTENLNNALSSQKIDSSVSNIEKTTENVMQITSEIDSTTIPIVNNILCQTYSTVKNTNEITGGVKNTLNKKMGLSRLLFGKPLTKDCE